MTQIAVNIYVVVVCFIAGWLFSAALRIGMQWAKGRRQAQRAQEDYRP